MKEFFLKLLDDLAEWSFLNKTNCTFRANVYVLDLLDRQLLSIRDG